MTERVIYLEGIDPLQFFGVNNALFEKFARAFPKVKAVGRGQEIKVFGEATEVADFEERLDVCLQYIQKFNRLTEEDMAMILENPVDAAMQLSLEEEDIILYGNNGKSIRARTVNQRKLIEEALHNDLLFAIGPAGTGKTYTAIALAVKAFKNKAVKKIILTRPAVEAGEKLGFLPGDMKEKLDPYLQPLYDALDDMIPARKLEGHITEGTIQIAPLAYMRGRTLDHAFVILDEAQNATSSQLKMFLTRMGRNAKFIVTGDITQIDLPHPKDSGLVPALKMLKDIPGISIVHFDNRDIIRHKLVKHIIEAYKAWQSAEKQRNLTPEQTSKTCTMNDAIVKTGFSFPGQKNLYVGKVRDVYNIQNQWLVMVVTDRISAFDVVLPRGIPFKGQVLNQIASKFLDATRDIVPNWKIASPHPMVTIGHMCDAFKVEMVIRGYLTGHAWREYKSGKRSICGIPIPEGMKENQKFDQPIITPTTKASEGHDLDISREEILAQDIVSKEDYDLLEQYTRALFERGSQMAEEKGLLLVDTKYEFGKKDGKIYLIDEIHTPDSSRYFYKAGYTERLAAGEPQRQLSKEFVRQWLIANGFQGQANQQVPEMTDAYVAEVSDRYIELYENITGEPFQKQQGGQILKDIEHSVIQALKELGC